MTPPLLKVEGLHVRYGKVEALTDVDLHLSAGEIVTVIGPNGAGKSTLLNTIMGLLPVHSGQVSYQSPAGAVLDQEAPVTRKVAAGLSLVPEKRELFTTMTVQDNLALGAYARPAAERRDGATLREVFELFPRLQERRLQLAGTLSGGERQMLAIGRALMAKPALLMLDEPSLGLAPLIVRDIFLIISRLREQGVSILLVEQNARAALQIADRGYVLETSTMALTGSAASLRDDARIAQMYLGGSTKLVG